MFLDDYGFKSNLDKNMFTYDNAYHYWKNTLFEYAMKVISIEGLPTTIPMHEVLLNLFIYGKCGIQKTKKGEWIASHINLFGNTQYYDKFTSYTWNTPIESGTVKQIGVDGFLIRNNSLMNGIFNKIHRYACLLSHTDVTLACRLINMRDDEVFNAPTESIAQTINTFQKKKANGQRYTMIDPSQMIEKVDLGEHANYSTEIRELFELRTNLFASFLEELGMKKSGEKKQRLIESEVTSDNAFLQLNIKDMVDTQQSDFDIFNDATGFNVRVVANVDYDKMEVGVVNE